MGYPAARFRSSVAGAPCGPGRLATGSAAPGLTHGRAVAVLPGWPDLRRSCHICATQGSEPRSTAVTTGHSPAVYLDRCCRSSPGGTGDRSSKLVMPVRSRSPALSVPVQVSALPGPRPIVAREHNQPGPEPPRARCPLVSLPRSGDESHQGPPQAGPSRSPGRSGSAGSSRTVPRSRSTGRGAKRCRR